MTIKDLAAKTGYAVGTVSRVLNNHPNVSETARAAILAAVEESGFQLNVSDDERFLIKRNLIVTVGTDDRNFFLNVFQEIIHVFCVHFIKDFRMFELGNTRIDIGIACGNAQLNRT